jgi:TonB family protein
MIPLNELKAPAVGCTWHEVAALVLDATTAVREQPASDLSNLATIRLSAEGYVELPAGPEAEAPVVQLARLLQVLLLDLPAPDALRAIATRYQAATADDTSLDAFASELARFERPDRTAVLVQLAARAASVDRSVDGPTSLAQLASRVRAAEEAGGNSSARSLAAPPRRRRPALVIVPVIVAVSAAALAALSYFAAPPSPAGATPQPVVARVRAGAAQLVTKAAQVFTSATSAPEPQPASAPETPRTDRPSTPARRTRPVPAPDAVVSVRSLEMGVAAPEPEVGPAPAPAPADLAVYTSGDPGVTPAALVRPHLPSQSPLGVADDEVGVLELTVTETGQVAHVRLLSTSARYQERMLLSAAKSWRFQPATKDGRPVRFRARVRITI